MIDDAKIESILKRYRPSGPPKELKEQIFPPEKTKAISFLQTYKDKKTHWIRYATIAASITIVTSCFVLWHIQERSDETHFSIVEIERKISESGKAARLLAAADLLAQYPDHKDIVRQQYSYIIDMYPQTTSAAQVKLKMKNF